LVIRLLSTITKRETNTALTHLQLAKHIQSLEEKVCHYEQTFNTAPNGYTINNNHIPNFQIPVSPNLFHPAKWVKLNQDGTVSGFANTQGPHNEPFIKDLYAQLDFEYDEEAGLLLVPPIPTWFRHLLIRLLNEFLLCSHVGAA
jgi:hypothetical protein